MSSKPEDDKERLFQAAKTIFFHIQDLSSFTNTLIELFNHNMNTQILWTAVKEDSNIRDFFEQMLKVVAEIQSVVDAANKTVENEPLYPKIAMALSSMIEQRTNVRELYLSARKMFRNAHIPLIISVLNHGNVLGILTSCITALMKFPIMNLQLSDFYRKDTGEQSEATTSEKNTSSDPPEANMTDKLKKLQDAFRGENTTNPTAFAVEQLEQIIGNLGLASEVLQKATKTMQTNISLFKKVPEK
ncbi:uncharacterized protein C12orf60 homolog [Echinops telfairi]|uniref:Uncharacterized protein C12orf60 homolog n=1 Tax=Echinops telfairi TaxID=9371 RepID=A0ABM0J395_ECHTE|nr:uncharacterized protein C12orf60 homolog [Echinops telfairi]